MVYLNKVLSKKQEAFWFVSLASAIESKTDLVSSKDFHTEALEFKGDCSVICHRIGKILKDKGDLDGALKYYE